MSFLFQKVNYESLNAKRKEAYNFQKVSGVLADYGFLTIRLSDDWGGADFLAVHISGETLRIQLKGRLHFSKKYFEKDLWICFHDTLNWYFYPHNEAFERVKNLNIISNTDSWDIQGVYHRGKLSKKLSQLMKMYILDNSSLIPPTTL
ncbi:MAG: hypothetical protein K2V71_02940 [Methylotenera sp.]|nr:hypothetical protein [Methylotenera sp.]